MPGQAVNAPSYERAMLLLSDQPGIRVSSGLQEGTQPGTTDLTVDVVGGAALGLHAPRPTTTAPRNPGATASAAPRAGSAPSASATTSTRA